MVTYAIIGGVLHYGDSVTYLFNQKKILLTMAP